MRIAAFIPIALASALAAANAPGLVGLTIVATDGKGQPVTDLSAADLQVTDNGKPQDAAFFRRTPSRLQPPAALAPGQFSNRNSGPFPHTTLVLFDLLNTDLTYRGFSTGELARRLQGLENADSLYFYLLALDGKLFPVHALPSGPADVKQSDPWTRQIKSLLDDALKKVNMLRPGDRVIDTQVRQTYAALENVVSTLAMMPGRSSLVWITHGVPISIRLLSGDDDFSYAPLLRHLAASSERARTIVYTVDPSGAPPTSATAIADADTLQQLANLTGGLSLNSDDVSTAVRAAMNDSRSSYRVEYALPSDAWDAKLHKVRVISTRKGVTLQTRQSYYADPPAEGALDRAALQAAVSSPFDMPDVGLRVAVATGSKPQSLRFHIYIDPSDTLLVHQGSTYTGQLAVAFVHFGKEGPKSVSTPVVDTVSLTQTQFDSAARTGILIDEDQAIAAGTNRVRVIVYDRGSDLTGSLTVPVQ